MVDARTERSDWLTRSEGHAGVEDDSKAEIVPLILFLGFIAYGFGCLPAIGQRGYPPLHPFWEAMRWLWIVPILLSGVLTSTRSRLRVLSLALYAIATAFIDAAASDMYSVPKHLNMEFVSELTCILYGPAHLVCALLLEFGLMGIQKLFGRFIPKSAGVQN